MDAPRQNISGFDRKQLSDFLESIGEKPFRGKQIYTWMYRKLENDFDRMTDLGKSLRAKLLQTAVISLPEIETVETTRNGSSSKYRFRLEDGLAIESVLMKESARVTLCVSTQVGCALGCKFCATGSMGFQRNLTVAEIIGQFISASRHSGENITNVVFMGMGEPLLNYDNVAKSVGLLTDSDGLAVSSRRITLSTVGIVPGIDRMAADRLPVKLAISLNAPDDKLRSELMPITKKYPLSELFAVAHRYEKTTRHRVTYEYVLIKGVNDTKKHADALKKTLSGFTAKLNLIEYNPVQFTGSANNTLAPLFPPDPGTSQKFQTALERPGLAVMIRKSLGGEISAACGQLCIDEHRQ
ncbi:MAG: 23S rRNA (adenine(2503)-C(2))-methyltransferase RlmN [FCB group bacterium]|nr:23S rRNA (adenine(2503)-C(2))-methyltransferase RlmN [FCB group bacterium]